MMDGTHLTGLEGTNPLAFLAALGLQVVFEGEEQPRLWWTDDIIPHAVVDAGFTVERIVDQAMRAIAAWRDSPTLDPGFGPKGDVKFTPEDIRAYLAISLDRKPGGALASALVAEGSLDGKGVAKPTDLYFTAGRQLFLGMAREVLGGVDRAAIVEGLLGPWGYESELPSLMWDVVDDRNYALAAFDPASDAKKTNPGPEALALLGLTLHPVYAGRERTLTVGCSGSWKRGAYTWPLWTTPAGPGAVRSLLAHAQEPDGGPSSQRPRWYRSWGIALILRSAIRRSEQGGYGTFGPPQVVWQR